MPARRATLRPKWSTCVAISLWLTACGSRSGLETFVGSGIDEDAGGGAGGVGGAGSGGRGAGGPAAGGQSSGGTGGQNSGGQNSGGEAAGGRTTGGQNSGGQNMGGGPGCPDGYIDEGNGCQPILTDLWTFDGEVSPPISPTGRTYEVSVPIWGLPQHLVARFPADARVHITPFGADPSQAQEMFDSQPWRAPSLVPGQTNVFDLEVSEQGRPSSWYTLTTRREGLFHYIKASNTGSSDLFGQHVAVSGDGLTLAVGAMGEDSAATGVNGDQLDDSADAAGAVYVLTWDGATWTQEAYLKASNAGAGDQFGWSLDLSGDGNVLVVGARLEASAATGVGGDRLDDSADQAGAAYVFARSGGTWHEEAYVKASNTGSDDRFGTDVAVAADGKTFAVGAPHEASSAAGIDGDQSLNDARDAGAVYVFSRTGNAVVQEAYIKSSNVASESRFGDALDLSDDGNTLVVGVPGAMAACAFQRQSSTWLQHAYITSPDMMMPSDSFGSNVALSGDGSTLAVSANTLWDDSGETGVGAVYILARGLPGWTHESRIKATPVQSWQALTSLALSYDGNVLVAGSWDDRSPAAGINGDPLAEPRTVHVGAAYRFERADADWEQSAYIKPSNPDQGHAFGFSVDVSGDGKTIVVSANGDDSSATGINGDAGNHDAIRSGAVYSYTEE